jgi:hypothetical protein
MVIGGEYGDIVFLDGMPGLEIGDGHAYAQLLSLIAPRDDTAIVVAEYDDRLVPEIGPEDPLAGAVEAIAVDYGFHYVLISCHRAWIT